MKTFHKVENNLVTFSKCLSFITSTGTYVGQLLGLLDCRTEAIQSAITMLVARAEWSYLCFDPNVWKKLHQKLQPDPCKIFGYRYQLIETYFTIVPQIL